MMKQKHFIDSHKGATPFAVLALMWWFDVWGNTTLWAYFATHGMYGVMWVLKSLTFGDRQWEQKCGLPYGLVIWGGLTLYWIAPYLIASQGIEAPPWVIGTCLAVYAVGVFFHFVSDMQKHMQLSLKPGLITTGLWAKTRNPNYFGELLIYAGFSALALHWAPFAVLALFVGAVWVPNMIKKDRSLSRYPEFETYKRRSGWMFPQLW
jgi:protein-S-isoprenylcysteine O-methyltransferase Ste14